MPALATDNFNRANENPLAAPWANSGQITLLSLALISQAASWTPMDDENRGQFYLGPSWPADQYSKARLFCVSTAGVRAGPSLYVRMASAVDTCYRFSTDHAAATNCNVSRFITGTRTTIVDFTQAWTDGDTWELRVEGPASAARVRVFRNGTQVSDNTDNSSISSGSPGLGVSGSSAMTSWSIDDWEGGSIGSEADNPPMGFSGRGAGW